MIFNRYWISDRSGSGVGKWKFFEGDYRNDEEEAIEDIRNSRESWALHADHSWDIELNVEPTREYVNSLCTKTANRIVSMQKYYDQLVQYEQGMK